MMESPKSLTAVVYVRFNYKETQAKPVSEGELGTFNKLMDQAYDLPPDLQDILVKFGTYLNGIRKGDNRAES